MNSQESTEKQAPRTTLVIGYGNTVRGDDGVGPALVHWVEQQHWAGVTAQTAQQLFPEMAQDVANFERVLFIDASAEPLPKVRLHPVLEASNTLMAHRCCPGSLLRMARELYGAQTEAHLLTIPADCMEAGTALSARTRFFMEEAQTLLTQFCAQD